MSTERAFYVLAYDLSDDRRRAKIARLMESLGERVQGSVFEAWLTPAELNRLVAKAKKILHEREDSLRIYMLCAACRGKIRVEGQGKPLPPPDVVIV
jgi:CRISPR-associated protein Cas2